MRPNKYARGFFISQFNPDHFKSAILFSNSQEFRDQIHEKSLQYASLYLALGKLNIVSDAFPNAIRATVHTKKDNKQIPLSLIPEEILFPWQGVPVVSESKKEETNSFQESTRIMRYWQTLKDPNTIAITPPVILNHYTI